MPRAGRAAKPGDRPASHAPGGVLVVDVRSAPPELALTAAGGEPLALLRELPSAAAAPAADLVVGVHDPDDGWASRFAAWSQSSAVPVLDVAIGASRGTIGPLTVPGRAGCGHCAHERMRAAAARDGRPATARPLVAALVRDALSARLGAAPARDLLDHVLLVEDGPASRHRVIPLARCRVCGGAAARTDHPSRGRMRPADPLAGWVDPVTGVIPALSVDRAHGDAGLPVVAFAAPPHVVDDGGALRRLPAGWGKGATASRAVLSAIGETIERYSASLADRRRVVWARPGELDGEHLDPRLLALYGDEQYAREGFPYVRFDPTVSHPWVGGRWLGSGERVWVPAVAAFLALDVAPENLICQGTSNGLAASSDLDDAALRATLELVERDAMMAAWLTGAAGRRVTLDGTLEPALVGVVRDLEAAGCAVEAYLLPDAACGAVALCLGLGDGRRWPGATIGMGADLDPVAAVGAAILELGQTGPYLAAELRAGTIRVPAGPSAVRALRDHATYWFPAERAGAFARLRGGRGALALGALERGAARRSLAAVASSLAGSGMRVAIVDVTSADVATGPFRVVRAVSPDLQPISYGHGLERVAVARIRDRTLRDAPEIHPIS